MSAPATIGGINAAAVVTIAGGEYSIGGGAYTSTEGTVTNGAAITVRVSASTTPGGTAEAVLTVGGVAATFRVLTSTDVTPPTARIVFPPPVARTSGATITVRGTASDASGPVAAVTVNGVAATSANGFATWVAEVPLLPGVNVLTVAAEDGFLNVASTAATGAVSRNARFGTPLGVAVDAQNGRAFVVDASADAVLSVDLATGIRTWFSDTAVPDLGRQSAAPSAVVLDAQRNRLLVLDGYSEAIVAIDLTTRQRTVLSGQHWANGPRFVSPIGLVLDDARNRVLVTASSPPAVIAVDLDSGARTVLSNAANGGPMFAFPISSALDAGHHRLLVADPNPPTIYAVSLDDGTRAVLSSNAVGPEPFTFVSAMAIDVTGNRVLVPQIGRVLAVDLASGSRSVFSTGLVVSHETTDLAIAGGRVIALDRGGLAAIELSSGDQSVLSPNNGPSGGVGLVQPSAMVLDLPNHRLLVADERLRAVVAVGLTSSAGTVIVDGSTGLGQFVAPRALALDSLSNRLFILQGHGSGPDPAIFVHDLTSGVRSVLSGPAHPNGNLPLLTTPQHMALDAPNMRLLVAERDARAILAVSLDGARSIVSSDAVPNGDNPFAEPLGIVVDAVNGRALVASSAVGPASRVLGMSLATGQRSVVVANTGGQLNGLKLLALDSARNRLLIAEELRDTIFAVDLTTQAAGQLTDVGDPDNPIDHPVGFAYDAATQIAYIAEGHFGAVLAVDLVTGRRAYLSH